MRRGSWCQVGSSGAVSPPDELVEVIQARSSNIFSRVGAIKTVGFKMCAGPAHLPGHTGPARSPFRKCGNTYAIHFDWLPT